ncbi:MAG TPA: hypothetical protein VFU40_09315 [Gemmatimonadales bacterium]|nr:hypothetical protein [Gemmatimonadales bacterium]
MTCWVAVMAGCGGAEARSAAGGVVDSVVPRDTAVARFQRAIPRVASFTGGAETRDALVLRFVTALERRDTVTLRSLLLTQSEFGWLYYPSNPEGLPPYNLTPQLMWFMLQGHSARGLERLLQQRSDKPLRYAGHRCDPKASRHGANTVWGPCVVLRRSETGDPITERLFGQIVERGGRYKFVSYTNKLD